MDTVFILWILVQNIFWHNSSDTVLPFLKVIKSTCYVYAYQCLRIILRYWSTAYKFKARKWSTDGWMDGWISTFRMVEYNTLPLFVWRVIRAYNIKSTINTTFRHQYRNSGLSHNLYKLIRVYVPAFGKMMMHIQTIKISQISTVDAPRLYLTL